MNEMHHGQNRGGGRKMSFKQKVALDQLLARGMDTFDFTIRCYLLFLNITFASFHFLTVVFK